MCSAFRHVESGPLVRSSYHAGASGGSDRMTATARSPKDTAAAPDRLHLKMLRQMLLIRRFEEKAAEAYALGKIGGFCICTSGRKRWLWVRSRR